MLQNEDCLYFRSVPDMRFTGLHVFPLEGCAIRWDWRIVPSSPRSNTKDNNTNKKSKGFLVFFLTWFYDVEIQTLGALFYKCIITILSYDHGGEAGY
jgi:hypothetical protein